LLGTDQEIIVSLAKKDGLELHMSVLSNTVAQFLAVCRRSKVGSMDTRRHRRGLRLCRR
jgi:hypothetical protein